MEDNVDDDSQYRMKEGDYVVLKRGDIYKAVQIESRKKVIFEKQWIFLDKAVGMFYGTTFEIESGGNLEPLELDSKGSSGSFTDAKEAGTDNRNIVDDGKSQKLTRDDIEMLKEQGLKGQEIIQELINNSTTFSEKTELSQDKYIEKKQKKYETHLTILKPSCRVLALMYHGREPGKICHLRYDTLAQMLTMVNIHAGSKVLVFETCAGLVLGAVMERMGGYGSVIQMYPGGGPVRACVESFGFPAHFHDMLHAFPICQVNALLAGTLNTTEKQPSAGVKQPVKAIEEEEQTQPNQEQEGSSEEQKMETDTVTDPAKDEEEKEKRKEVKAQEKKLKIEEKKRKLAAASELLRGMNADGLVVASRFHPCPVLMGLIKFLAPSRPFVVYSQYKEPLIECYTKLKEQGGTVNLVLAESWLRHYQVLPNRTHPMLLMSGGGGYFLSGITVVTDLSKPTGSQGAEGPAPKKLKLTETEG
ncbi:tRNA (adenine(58)-N(1))-methyltransferase non-catalytic subunit TRM6 [Lampris incognitus]|uniref:tRNA (adenine(58)-N(1))-methyltransferase non-catalytic subunit TRM6 n=1 Tax=Lampris incognitus TaxID=2546036 RepID=UPI0024B59D74|nr:tRNA (adenine(58)-N(1))-methyltransferase non-catalytic subunit TRM6 [Lampris incognitus]XP_056150340.1 tRNA (adenine(58)-N(1))-methyltransferase non-catalytic subunit TRM6 [Lampris incognitus]